MKRDRMRTGNQGTVVTMALTLAACGPMREGFDSGTDAHTATDARTDTGRVDAGTDAVADVARDAARDVPTVDTGSDAARDVATVDGGLDAAMDSGVDAGTDTGTDARTDTGTDARTDTGTDARSDVVVDAGPQAYTISNTTAACDDMTGATSLMITMEDSVSTVQPLPIPFSFFSMPQTFYSAASSGYLQFWPSATSTPVSAPFNSHIPLTANPNNFVAPFWDYLDVPSDGANMVVTKTFGDAVGSRHVTVQWTHWAYLLDEDERVTFQAKLFEAGSLIEFHYCVLMAGSEPGYETGSSATVGVENATGTSGVEVAYDHAGAVSTTTAIRLTPAP